MSNVDERHGVSSGHDVFISYSHANKAQADAVCALLERDGFRCWIAPRDVTPGRRFEEAIVRAIEGARLFVLIFSGSSNGSEQVRREVSLAANGELPIIPFRLENVRPNDTFAYYISSSHWLDALDPPLEAHIAKLSDAVARLLCPAPAPSEPSVAPRSAPHPQEAAAPQPSAAAAVGPPSGRPQVPWFLWLALGVVTVGPLVLAAVLSAPKPVPSYADSSTGPWSPYTLVAPLPVDQAVVQARALQGQWHASTCSGEAETLEVVGSSLRETRGDSVFLGTIEAGETNHFDVRSEDGDIRSYELFGTPPDKLSVSYGADEASLDLFVRCP
jgi:hypothetical protein